jgi:uncharacterized protein
MKNLATTLLLSGLTFFGFSQDTSKIGNIKTLLAVTGSGKLGVQVVQNMLTSFKQSFPNVPEEFWNDFMKEVNPEVLTTMIVPIYDKYYTQEDIKKMIEFYQTPLGKKLILTMPQIMQESMQVGQTWGKEIGEKVYNNLKEKGYVKEGQ